MIFAKVAFEKSPYFHPEKLLSFTMILINGVILVIILLLL